MVLRTDVTRLVPYITFERPGRTWCALNQTSVKVQGSMHLFMQIAVVIQLSLEIVRHIYSDKITVYCHTVIIIILRPRGVRRHSERMTSRAGYERIATLRNADCRAIHVRIGGRHVVALQRKPWITQTIAQCRFPRAVGVRLRRALRTGVVAQERLVESSPTVSTCTGDACKLDSHTFKPMICVITQIV